MDDMIVKTAENVVQCTFNGLWTNNRAFANVMHWQAAGPIPSGEAANLATVVETAWQDEMLDIFPNNYTYTGVDFIDLTDESGETGSLAPVSGHPTAGALTTASPPPSVATLVTKVLPSRARNTRNGRLFIPPPDETSLSEDGTFVTTGFQTVLNTFFGVIDSMTINGLGWVAVVPHWTDKPDDVPGDTVLWPAVGVSAIGSLLCQSLVATQRRRLRA